jgi:hypothetical protein
MPLMNGFELCQKLLQIDINVKMCFMPSGELIPLLIGECDPTVPEERTKSGKIEDLWACAREANEPFNTWAVALDGDVIFKKVGNEEVNAELKNEILIRNSSKFTLKSQSSIHMKFRQDRILQQ